MVSAHDVGRTGVSDEEQFVYAVSENRAIVTFNTVHFVSMANDALSVGRHFPGVIVSNQLPFKEMIRRVLRLLNRRQAEDILNSIIWLSDYR